MLKLVSASKSLGRVRLLGSELGVGLEFMV